jgi:competence protein ComEA
VPSTEHARPLLLGLLLAAGLAAFAPPAEGVAPVPVQLGARCALGEPGMAPPCPCGALPAALRLLQGLPLPLNRIGVEELAELPGIGPARAAAIAAEREQNGPFASAVELDRVPGIGPRTAEKLAPLMFTTGPDPACTS